MLDGQACGACCVNLPSNRAEGFTSWVEIDECDRILRKSDLVKKHVVRDADGISHLRLASDGRWLALRGALGRDVSCTIYGDRPTPCRALESGDALCLRYRVEHGIGASS